MKSLSDFKNIHKGKDIYVIGSGKSCDFISRDFFDNKITIGINEVFTRYSTTYLCRKEIWMIREAAPKKPNSIFFCSRGDCGGGNSKNLELAKKMEKEKKADNIVIFDHKNNICRPINIERDLPNLDENKLLVSYSTSCSAIHLALYMGAKNIILVGLDGGKIDGEINYKGYRIGHHSGRFNPKQYHNWIKTTCINSDMITLKTHFKKKYNCNVYSLNPFTNFRLDGHTFTP